MGQYIVRRVLLAIPTLIVISFVIFAVLELAPGDPTGALPETIKPEVRMMIREAMGRPYDDSPRLPVSGIVPFELWFHAETLLVKSKPEYISYSRMVLSRPRL